MAAAFDPSHDFAQVADRQQAVTLRRPDSLEQWPLAHAVRGAVSLSEARRSGGTVTENDVVWSLDADELETEPRPGDLILDAQSRRWTVLAVRETATGRRRCTCRNLAVVHQLDQSINLETAVYEKDDTGTEVPTWRTWRAEIPARLQPVQSAITNEHDRHIRATEYKIHVADQLDIDHTHRIRAADGAIYQIVGCQKAQRIDALMEIDVVRVG